MASNKNDTVTVPLNYAETKEKYEELVNSNTDLMNKHPLSTDEKIENKIKQIQNLEATEPDLAVLNLSLKTKLYRKRDNLLLEVLSVEESFDVILNAHIALGHTSAAITYKELISKVSIPTFAVSWVALACNVCEHKRKNKTPRPANSAPVAQKAVVKPVEEPQPTRLEPQPQTTKVQEPLPIPPKPKYTAPQIQKVQKPEYKIPQVQKLPQTESKASQTQNLPKRTNLHSKVIQKKTVDIPSGKKWRLNLIKHSSLIQSHNTRTCYLLIYRQVDTNFLILRPVFETSMELALELMKIFTEFGYPAKLYVNKLLEFYVQVIQVVRSINPVAPFDVELVKDTCSFDDDEMDVIMEIHKWMDLMNDVYWDQCLHIVQYRLNTKELTFVRMDTKEICIGKPFEMFFNFKVNTEIKWINPKTNELAFDFTKNVDEESSCTDSD
uniref:Uncharacterized protein n=1 Tax=Heliothis virescens TaxID=7102 RepID=A0A2A4JAU8_HELVI